tara:strand:- start:4619 stop:4936 length:318 start_codon:yes stop_codon:yes gene_type:complete
MDCQSEEHKCDNLYGECRCYADVNTKNPGSDQVCGIRKKGYIIPCKAGCCDGGCPGQCTNALKPRQPYAFGKLYPMSLDKLIGNMICIAIILVLLSTYIIILKRT